MALHPGLRGLVLLDDGTGDIDGRLIVVARLLAEALQAVTGRQVHEVRLGSATTDDDLWTGLRLRPHPAGHGVSLVHEPRALLEQPTGDDPVAALPLMIITDLDALSVPAARAVVTVAGAETAAIERDGFSYRWAPSGVWVAACQTARIGSVSPHLLDRFPLHAPASALFQPAHSRSPETEPVFMERSGPPEKGSVTRLPGRTSVAQASAIAAERWPGLAGPVLEELARRSAPGAAGHRRSIALARLAVACARRRGGDRVETHDVKAAFGLLGLPWSAAVADANGPENKPPAGTHTDSAPQPDQSGPRTSASGGANPAREALIVRDEADEARVGLPVESGGPAEPVHDVALSADDKDPAGFATAYPEDHAELLREAEPLRLPWTTSWTVRQLRGPVIGTRPAGDLRDIAVVPSLLRAVTRRAASQPGTPVGGPILVEAGDLRAYRRAPLPEQLLVLLLDHTARGEQSWIPVLSDYLEWAYVRRLPMAVIEVGVADKPAEDGTGSTRSGPAQPRLRAEQFLTRSVLDPRVETALAARAGTASPLAHGLDLAYWTVRHALLHGAALIRDACLVIATDGRGNVPLAASRLDKISLPVGTEGVRDALEAAAELRKLRRLVTEVIDLGTAPYADLPSQLARASGATIRKACHD
jgi:magnesium chelatase subunit D